MTTEIRLTTKLNEFEKLHEIADRKGEYVTVKKDFLSHILIDHSVMTKALQSSSGFKLIEPRERVKAKE